MIKANEVKSKIILILERRGPALPIQIAKELNMNSLFVSAFLSELTDEKKIKVSHLKVGGSPLYFLTGQEQQLERFQQFLHPKESEAYILLKNNKVLKDSEQEPAIRVALRSIRDFAFSFKNDEEIYWRYLTLTEPEVIEIFSKKISKQKQEPVKEKEKEKPKVEEEIEEKPKKKQKEIEDIQIETSRKPKQKQEELLFNNPLASKPVEKPKKEKPKSEFVIKTIEFLNKNQFRIIQEKEYKAKEYFCIAEISTELGPIAFLTISKDKKSVSDSDLADILKQAQSIPLPALFLYTGALSKKAIEFQNKYYSILKTKKIE